MNAMLNCVITMYPRDKTDQEMDMIRLQREVRDSSNRMSTMRAKCTATEQVCNHVPIYTPYPIALLALISYSLTCYRVLRF